MPSDVLMQISGLKKYYRSLNDSGRRAMVHAVDDVSFSIMRGETFGLVGESGCGKSTLGRTVLFLTPPTDGHVVFDGVNLTERNIRPLRSRMQLIFQNPAGSLDPSMRIKDILNEALIAAGQKLKGDARRDAVTEILESVGLTANDGERFPHQFSGGQQQRISIARALAVKPDFLVCDEPISSLDVSYLSQIINLLEDLQQERGLTYLFIAHDLAVVRHISTRIGVMYCGKMMELGDADTLCSSPSHPYTQALLASVPIPDPDATAGRTRITLKGEPPSLIAPPSGCRFRQRCLYAEDICARQEPVLRDDGTGHFCACHMVK